MWFGHMFFKQGMSPDQDKVAHIKAWQAPKSKDKVKSFLQWYKCSSSQISLSSRRPSATPS